MHSLSSQNIWPEVQTVRLAIEIVFIPCPNDSIMKIDPFENVRKNAHIWRGEQCLIWYNERIDDSFTLLVLYDFGDKKRRLFLDVDKTGQRIEFKNEEILSELFFKIEAEINLIQRFLGY